MPWKQLTEIRVAHRWKEIREQKMKRAQCAWQAFNRCRVHPFAICRLLFQTKRRRRYTRTSCFYAMGDGSRRKQLGLDKFLCRFLLLPVEEKYIYLISQ